MVILPIGVHFGEDPPENDVEKLRIRGSLFGNKYPTFDPIFHNLVNGNVELFQTGLELFIDITYRLSS